LLVVVGSVNEHAGKNEGPDGFEHADGMAIEQKKQNQENRCYKNPHRCPPRTLMGDEHKFIKLRPCYLQNEKGGDVKRRHPEPPD
jgi:hypothetical protein